MKYTTLVLDVDGVLTTGQFLYTVDGKFAKIFGPHDSDGIKLIKKKLNVIAITADTRGLSITKKRVEEDMGITLFVVKEEDRMGWFKKTMDLRKTIYMGDGIFDAEIFPLVGYSIAPNNAFFLAKNSAKFVTRANGGEGAVAEACLYIMEKLLDKDL